MVIVVRSVQGGRMGRRPAHPKSQTRKIRMLQLDAFRIVGLLTHVTWIQFFNTCYLPIPAFMIWNVCLSHIPQHCTRIWLGHAIKQLRRALPDFCTPLVVVVHVQIQLAFRNCKHWKAFSRAFTGASKWRINANASNCVEPCIEYVEVFLSSVEPSWYNRSVRDFQWTTYSPSPRVQCLCD